MKAALILAGISLAAVANAQVRTQPPATTATHIADNLRTVDPQITLLKKQMAEMAQQIAELQKKNADLAYCLKQLDKEVRILKNPNAQYDDAVKVAPSQGLYQTQCN